jgi:hypothetical protein
MRHDSNEVRLTGKVLAAPKLSRARYRGVPVARASFFLEVAYAPRLDRFRIEVTCPAHVEIARLLKKGACVDVIGVLRRDVWLGRIYVALDLGHGAIARVDDADAAQAMAEWRELWGMAPEA